MRHENGRFARSFNLRAFQAGHPDFISHMKEVLSLYMQELESDGFFLQGQMYNAYPDWNSQGEGEYCTLVVNLEGMEKRPSFTMDGMAYRMDGKICLYDGRWREADELVLAPYGGGLLMSKSSRDKIYGQARHFMVNYHY